MLETLGTEYQIRKVCLCSPLIIKETKRGYLLIYARVSGEPRDITPTTLSKDVTVLKWVLGHILEEQILKFEDTRSKFAQKSAGLYSSRRDVIENVRSFREWGCRRGNRIPKFRFCGVIRMLTPHTRHNYLVLPSIPNFVLLRKNVSSKISTKIQRSTLSNNIQRLYKERLSKARQGRVQG